MSKTKWNEWRPLTPCREWRYTDKTTKEVVYQFTILYFTGCNCLLCEFDDRRKK